MKKIIHIPHSSTKIPYEFLSDYVISLDHLKRESEFMCDKNTDLLVDNDNDVIIFPYSRIFCDVERFNNEKEEMNTVGMGVVYTHTHDLKLSRVPKNIDDILKIYNDYHSKLNLLTSDILNDHGEVLILDIHSYSNEILDYELHKELERPEICIGIDDFHMDEILRNKILYIVKESGFKFAINQPFIGTIIPSEYLNDSRVKSVMIDVNKKVMKTDFQKIKNLIKCLTEI